MPIPRGTGPERAADLLSAAGVAGPPFLVSWTLRAATAGKPVPEGRYWFHSKPSVLVAAMRLARGDAARREIVVENGATARDIAARLDGLGISDAGQFVRAVRSPEIARETGGRTTTAEGYLAPGTYLFPSHTDPEDVARAMIRRFRAGFTPRMRLRAARLGLSCDEVVTLASIVEKEAAGRAEKALVAGVIHRRLRIGMRMQMCSTVAYGLGKPGKDLRPRDYAAAHPYNTYLRHGVPPGAISNPGRASLAAVLWPDDRGYLYFAADGDGRNVFSKTFEEHLRAVRAARGEEDPDDAG